MCPNATITGVCGMSLIGVGAFPNGWWSCCPSCAFDLLSYLSACCSSTSISFSPSASIFRRLQPISIPLLPRLSRFPSCTSQSYCKIEGLERLGGIRLVNTQEQIRMDKGTSNTILQLRLTSINLFYDLSISTVGET